jgi:hypothetical protein
MERLSQENPDAEVYLREIEPDYVGPLMIGAAMGPWLRLKGVEGHYGWTGPGVHLFGINR